MDNTVLKAIHDMPGPHGRLQKLLSQMVCQIYISFGSLTSVLTYSSLFVTATSYFFYSSYYVYLLIFVTYYYFYLISLLLVKYILSSSNKAGHSGLHTGMIGKRVFEIISGIIFIRT